MATVKKPDSPYLDAPNAVLTAFVRAVATAGDSPTVISRVAENAAYLDLCRRVVALDAARETPPLLQEACRTADITLDRLRARLTPVAQALHLIPDAPEDAFYKVLGVAPDSDADTIRRAYRRRARDLHPDLQPGQMPDAQGFTALTEAYETLRDPVAKEAYDTRLAAETTWYEPDPHVRRHARPRRARFTAVIVVVLLLVAAALVLDQLDRARGRRSAYQASRHRVIRPVAPPARPLSQKASFPIDPPEPTPAPGQTRPRPEKTSAAGPLLVGAAPPPPALSESAPPEQAIQPPEKPRPSTPDTSNGEADSAGREDPIDVAATSTPSLRLAIFHAGADGARLSGKLAAHLSDKGYPQARIGPTPESLVRPSNIRYFNGADRDTARTLRAAVRAFLAANAPRTEPIVQLKNLSRRYPRRERGLIEVWLNTGTSAEAVPDSKESPPLRPVSAVTAVADTPIPDEPAPPTDTRIRAFIDHYCRTYEARDPDRLAALFDPAATENGRPFKDLLPRYRDNMARLERLSYRIEIARWEARGETATLAVEGRFTAEGRMADQQHFRSRGTIALDVVPHGTSYRVLRLDYRIEN